MVTSPRLCYSFARDDEWQTARALRAVPHRLPPHRRRPHGALQLALGAQDRRHVRPPHRGHRSGAQHRTRAAQIIFDSHALARPRLGRGPRASAASTARTRRWSASPSTRSTPRSSSRERKAYRCYCTKEELDAQREALKAKDPKAQFRYPGTCRDRTDEPDQPYVVRFKTPHARARSRYVDKVFGEVDDARTSTQQDFVLLRSDGVPLYNFGAVVDDMTMEHHARRARPRSHDQHAAADHALRGASARSSPEFAHLPMMLAPSGEKLSKRHGAVSVGEYRDQGYAPDAVLNYLVRFGWSHGDQEVFSKDELVAGVRLGGVRARRREVRREEVPRHQPRAPRRPSGSCRATSTRRAPLPFLEKRGLDGVDARRREACALRRFASARTTFVEAADVLDFFFREPPVMDEKARRRSSSCQDAAPNLARLPRRAREGAPSGPRPRSRRACNAWLAEKRPRDEGRRPSPRASRSPGAPRARASSR